MIFWLQDHAQRHPRLFAGIWFMVSAMPGSVFLLCTTLRYVSEVFLFILMFVLGPLLCAFISGALWGSTLCDARRIGTVTGAVVRGMWVICLAYLIFIAIISFIYIVPQIVSGENPMSEVRFVLVGFLLYGLPSMLGGGLGGWLLRRLMLRTTGTDRPSEIVSS